METPSSEKPGYTAPSPLVVVDNLPSATSPPGQQTRRRRAVTSKTIRRLLGLLLCACIAQSVYTLSSFYLNTSSFSFNTQSRAHRSRYRNRARYESDLAKCRDIHTPAGPPPSFHPSQRVRGTDGEGVEGGGGASDRWVPGTPPLLIRNAKIWTGARNGTEVVYGDVLLDRGLVLGVGYIPESLLERVGGENGKLEVLDVQGKWVTPGLVDLHSHIGVSAAPHLSGAADGNSRKAPILPWLRSIDGLNTHDDSYELALAGGVTTAQVLPGSANNIGGQAFVIKLRPTHERSATSKVIEPPQTLIHAPNGTAYPRWRHMKHACGENPDRVYSQTRMDAQWNFRHAYDEARKLRDRQDKFCARLEGRGEVGFGSGFDFDAEGEEGGEEEGFPEDLQWESLVDVLRGRVKLSIHCYEAVDLDGIVRLSNEFKFPVASFHHAGETYLVPELLKKTYGGAPAIALFATNFRKKREAYRGSEFAPRVLAEHDIPVVMKSDHPVVNSRYLIYEAQLAHYYGLHNSLALASVTSVPAHAAGLGHRVGSIAEGYDADIVLWDSHPLALGATPQQVWVDGIAQLKDAHVLRKPAAFQDVPRVPDWEKEKEETVKWEGLPPLKGWESPSGSDEAHGGVDSALPSDVLQNGKEKKKRVMIKGVKSLTVFDDHAQRPHVVFDHSAESIAGWNIIVEDGIILSTWGPSASYPIINNDTQHTPHFPLNGTQLEELEHFAFDAVVDLQGGAIETGLTTFGAPIGLVEIRLEASTNDGDVWDPLTRGDVPSLLEGPEGAGDEGVIRAVDGLAFGGRNTLLAYRAGVTTAITAPTGNGFLRGLGVAFSVGAPHALVDGAIVQPETGLHVALSLGFGKASVSTQVAALRRKLFGDGKDEEEEEDEGKTGSPTTGAWERVREGSIPLVVSVESADIMTTLLTLKSEYESATGKQLKLTFSGATEAHLLADEIAQAGVSVVLTSPRPFPGAWEQRRILPGPPLSRESAVTTLLNAGVNVAIGVVDEASARNARFDLAWVALEANGTISKAQAIALASTNLHKALGLAPGAPLSNDLVLYSGGGVLDFESKPVGVISASRGSVELF